MTEINVLKKAHWGNLVHGNDTVTGMKWKSVSVWLFSIYNNLNGIGLSARPHG